MTPLSTFLAARYGGPLSRARIEKLQRRGFAHLRRNIMPKSSLYAAYADRPLAEWPLMDKARMMEQFSALNTAGLQRDAALEVALAAEETRDFSPLIGQIAVGLSTGTSGQRGLFASNRRERALWAALMVGRFMPSMLARQRVAFFLRANNQLYESLGNRWIDFRFFDLLQPLDAQLAQLQAQDPTVLIAPAQILGLLARAQLAGKLTLQPQVVISVAEVASPEDAALVQAAFNRRLDQVYQCTEGVLGMTCAAGSLHLNERFVHIEREVIDEASGAFVPILTDLARQTQPILRYRLDDVLVPDPEPCPCGCESLRLLRIEGRCDDILYWRGEMAGQRMIPSDAIRQAVAGARSLVLDYRAEQYGPDHLVLSLESPEMAQACTEITERLQTQAQTHGARLPKLHFRAQIAPMPGRKRRRVIAHPPQDLPTDLCPDLSPDRGLALQGAQP